MVGADSTNKGAEVPISVNMRDRVEVMLIEPLETEGGGGGYGSPHWRLN